MQVERTIMESSSLNLATALVITAAALKGAQSRRGILAFSASLLSFAAIVYFRLAGVEGILFALSGSAAAALLTIPLVKLRNLSPVVIAISAAVGSVLGVTGFALAFIIALIFYALRVALRVEMLASRDRICDIIRRAGNGLVEREEKSALVVIEARKIMRDDSVQFPESPDEAPARDRRAEVGRVQTFSWCADLALSTIAVLMLGTSL